MFFTLKSNGIIKGMIDRRYGKFSEDVINGIPQISIPLEWSGCPEGTGRIMAALVCSEYPVGCDLSG